MGIARMMTRYPVQTTSLVALNAMSVLTGQGPLGWITSVSDEAAQLIQAQITARGTAMVRQQRADPNAPQVPELLQQFVGGLKMPDF